jgi:hypothetical protein
MTTLLQPKSYRLAITLDNHVYQLYFRSEEERDAMGRIAAALTGNDLSAGVVRNRIKRNNATHSTLPVGITEAVGQRSRGKLYMKTRKDKPLGRFSTWIDDVAVHSYYGNKRSRNEALSELIQRRLAWIAECRRKESPRNRGLGDVILS